MFILPHGTWKDNISSVILNWRQRSAGRSSEVERSAGLSSEGRDLWVTQANMLCVFSSHCTTSQKGPCHRRKIYTNSLWLYFYYTESSPWKNKDINCIFIYINQSFVVCPAVQYETIWLLKKKPKSEWSSIVNPQALIYQFSLSDWS